MKITQTFIEGEIAKLNGFDDSAQCMEGEAE